MILPCFFRIAGKHFLVEIEGNAEDGKGEFNANNVKIAVTIDMNYHHYNENYYYYYYFFKV